MNKYGWYLSIYGINIQLLHLNDKTYILHHSYSCGTYVSNVTLNAYDTYASYVPIGTYCPYTTYGAYETYCAYGAHGSYGV
jgi:hypothetical protein